MKKIANWLVGAHFPIMGDGGKDSVCYLWSILISLVSMTLFGAMGWNGKAFEMLCAVLYLGSSVIPPVIACIVTLFGRKEFEPWYWFPCVIGCVVGGMIAIVIGLVGGWCTLF